MKKIIATLAEKIKELSLNGRLFKPFEPELKIKDDWVYDDFIVWDNLQHGISQEELDKALSVFMQSL